MRAALLRSIVPSSPPGSRPRCGRRFARLCRQLPPLPLVRADVQGDRGVGRGSVHADSHPETTKAHLASVPGWMRDVLRVFDWRNVNPAVEGLSEKPKP